MDLSPFTRAGLKRKEIGEIVGVSSTTAGLWMLGKRDPHYLLEPKVSDILLAIDLAVRASELPLSSQVPRAERLKKIQRVVERYNTKVTPRQVG